MASPGGVAMSDLIWLSEAQMRRIEPYFLLSPVEFERQQILKAEGV